MHPVVMGVCDWLVGTGSCIVVGLVFGWWASAEAVRELALVRPTRSTPTLKSVAGKCLGRRGRLRPASFNEPDRAARQLPASFALARRRWIVSAIRMTGIAPAISLTRASPADAR